VCAATPTSCASSSEETTVFVAAPMATIQIDAVQTPTFSVVVQGSVTTPFNPDVNRIFPEFIDNHGVVRGRARPH